MKNYRVRAHTVEEAWDLCCTAWQIAEGPQNESTRYADTEISYAFRQADYCYIGIVGGSWLRIINVHDRYGKKFKEVSKSKFCSIYGIKERKRKGNLPKSLRNIGGGLTWQKLR